MIIPTALFGDPGFDHQFKFIIAGMLILFYIGIKDDILTVSPQKKVMAELVAVLLIVVFGDIRITSFHGILGIEALPFLASIAFTVLMFLVVINGINLIDGIDGLASGVGILTSSSLGAWFMLAGSYSYAAFCFSTTGALVAFFYFNVFSKKRKIFLGDNGSLIIGLVLTVFTIQFLELNPPGNTGAGILSMATPAVAVGLLILPLVDTLRVFTLRLIQGKSPFHADLQHIHHCLIRRRFSHLQSSLILFTYNITMVLLALSLRQRGDVITLLIMVPAALLIASVPGIMNRYERWIRQKEHYLPAHTGWNLSTIFAATLRTRRKHMNGAASVSHSGSPYRHFSRRGLEPVLQKTEPSIVAESELLEENELVIDHTEIANTSKPTLSKVASITL